MYCNASSTAFPAVRCFQFRKRYWYCKLPCIEAQIELSSTFVYDQKMSTSGSSARNSHLSPGGRMTMMLMSVIACEPICINMYCRAKHNNQEKKYPFIEGRSDKNFRVVNLFTGSIFAIILFCTVMLFGSRAWSSLFFIPPG